MADTLAQDVLSEWERLDGDAGTWKSQCQRVALYLDPDRSDFTVERTPGTRRTQYVFDSTPLFAHETGAAFLHAMYTSDALPWFSTGPEDDRLAADPAIKQWFADADAYDYGCFNNPLYNFTSQSHEVYLDVLAYGGAAHALLDGRNGPLFTTRHLKECRFSENEEDRVDGLSRRWQWTAKQAFDEWGPRAGEKVLKALADNKPNEKFWFHHRVKPRALAQRDPRRADRRNMPFESVYVAEAELAVIELGGFSEFPYLCPRLSKRSAQDVMGRGRGFLMLSDIMMLNALARLVIRGGEKIIDPPLMLPDDGFIVPIRTAPGTFNYYRAGLRPSDRIAPITTNANIPVGQELLTRLETKIERGFFNDLATTPIDPGDPAAAGKGVTATFTDKISREQRMRASPLNARLSAEWAAPLVLRMRAMNFRKSVLHRFGPGSPYKPPPARLNGQRLRPQFKSPIALAQRAAEMNAIDQLVQRQLMLRQIDPEAPLIIDSEALMRLDARDLNVPPAILKSPRMIAAEQATRARMAEEQHQAQIAQGATAAAGNLAGAHATLQAAA